MPAACVPASIETSSRPQTQFQDTPSESSEAESSDSSTAEEEEEDWESGEWFFQVFAFKKKFGFIKLIQYGLNH